MQAEGNVNVSDEIQPYVVYRIEGEQMECALWQFKDGQKALALFLSGDAATTYRATANLEAAHRGDGPGQDGPHEHQHHEEYRVGEHRAPCLYAYGNSGGERWIRPRSRRREMKWDRGHAGSHDPQQLPNADQRSGLTTSPPEHLDQPPTVPSHARTP
jgi:hypothetical protein